jgi:hypothetical protein
LTTLPHFSVCWAIMRPKSAGEPDCTAELNGQSWGLRGRHAVYRQFAGVWRGRPAPYQDSCRYPGANSGALSTSGGAGQGAADLTAEAAACRCGRTRSRPAADRPVPAPSRDRGVVSSSAQTCCGVPIPATAPDIQGFPVAGFQKRCRKPARRAKRDLCRRGNRSRRLLHHPAPPSGHLRF